MTKVYAVRKIGTDELVFTSSNNATGLYSTKGAARIVKTQSDIRYYRHLDWYNNRSVYTKDKLPKDFVSPYEVIETELKDWIVID